MLLTTESAHGKVLSVVAAGPVPNSNTYPQAIADRATGEHVRVFESRPFGALGRRNWHKVSFCPRLKPMVKLAQTPLLLCPLREGEPTERILVASVPTAIE